MNETKAQPEPTMEEILASIRRIISDDGADTADKKEEAGIPAPAPVASSEPPSPAASATEAPAADVLELTQMVEDDGSVVDLAATPEAEHAPAPEMAASSESAASSPEPQPMAGPPSPEPDLAPQPEPVTEPEPTRPSAQQEKPMAPDNTPDERGLMSSSAAGTTTSAFAALAAAVDSSRGLAVGSGTRTLEDLVREMLRPMLRQWLDANLPSLVGRIVEREVAKLAGQAEDDRWQ